MFVWKGLYQYFVPIASNTKAEAGTYKKAVQIIYLHFGNLQKKLAAIGEVVIPKNDNDVRVCSCLFRDAIKNRIFFFAHALLEMLEARQVSWSYCWDFSSKLQAGALGAISFTLNNSPDQAKDVLADLHKLYEKFMDLAKRKNQEIAFSSLVEAIETLFDDAVEKKNLDRIYSIKRLCSEFFSEDTRNESLLFTLSAIVLSYGKDGDPKKMETAKFIAEFEPENEKLKAILGADLCNAIKKEDMETAKSILQARRASEKA